LACLQTALAGVGTIALVYALWLTRRSVRLAQQSADGSLAAATAAQEANKQTRELFLTDQRPWLVIEHDGPSEVDLLQNRLGFTIPFRLRNVGKSPAIDVTAWVFKLDIRQGTQTVEEELKEFARLAKGIAHTLHIETHVFPGVDVTMEREHSHNMTLSMGRPDERRGELVDYALVVGYTHAAASKRFCTVQAYTVELRHIPPLAMFREVIAPERWTTKPISGGTHAT
jgi:hypothetical protein